MRVRSNTKTIGFAIGVGLLFLWLLADISMSAAGYLSPMDRGLSTIVHGPPIYFEIEDRPLLLSRPVRAASYTQLSVADLLSIAQQGGTLSGITPQVTFEFRKREREGNDNS